MGGSFDDESFNWEASQVMDLIYTFRFDSAANPTYARVVAGGGSVASVVWKAVTLAIEFGLELLETPHPRYNTSVVWDRPSRFAGVEISSYQAVQIMTRRVKSSSPPSPTGWRTISWPRRAAAQTPSTTSRPSEAKRPLQRSAPQGKLPGAWMMAAHWAAQGWHGGDSRARLDLTQDE